MGDHTSWPNAAVNTSSLRLSLEGAISSGIDLAVTSGYFTKEYGNMWNSSTSNMDANSSNSSDGYLTTGEQDTVLWSSILAGIALCLIITMTICGNILVIVAIVINPHLRVTTNYFILNLAIADLLLGTTVLPFSASLEVVNHWVFGQFVCNIWAAMDVLCCTASIMSLCVISIDRYIGVTRPLQHSSIMTQKKAVIIIIVVWVLATAISVAPLAGWKEPPPEDPTICEVTKQLGYVLFSVSGSFYIPLIIILVVYYRVYREATKQSRFLSTGVKRSHNNSGITLRIHTGKPSQVNNACYDHELPSSPSSQMGHRSSARRSYSTTLAGKIVKFKREKKAAKTLGIVVGVFILCWFPFFFILPLEALCSACHIPPWLFKIIFWLGYCNSTMNPIIYACSSREFKRAFIRVLLCQCRRRFPAYITNTSRGYRTESRFARMKGAMKLCTRGERHSTKRKKPTSKNRKPRDYRLDSSPSATRFATQMSWSSPNDIRMMRKETMDSLVISDDESAVHEFSSSDGESDQVDQGLLMSRNINNCIESPTDDVNCPLTFTDGDAVIYSNVKQDNYVTSNGFKPNLRNERNYKASTSDSELYNRNHMYLCGGKHQNISKTVHEDICLTNINVVGDIFFNSEGTNDYEDGDFSPSCSQETELSREPDTCEIKRETYDMEFIRNHPVRMGHSTIAQSPLNHISSSNTQNKHQNGHSIDQCPSQNLRSPERLSGSLVLPVIVINQSEIKQNFSCSNVIK